MRHEITKKQTITEEREIVIETTVICNKCGKSVNPSYSDDMQNISISFGYESKFDGENWSFEICDDCLLDVVKTFKHVPEGFKEDNSIILIDNEEDHQKIFDYWKETGEWNELLFKSYEDLCELQGLLYTDVINDIIKKKHPDKPLLDYDDMDY